MFFSFVTVGLAFKVNFQYIEQILLVVRSFKTFPCPKEKCAGLLNKNISKLTNVERNYDIYNKYKLALN